MKTIFRLVRYVEFLLVVFSMSTATNPLNAQWIPNGLSGTVWSLAVSGTNLFAGTATGGVFLSTNNGATWAQTSLDSVFVGALAISDTNLFAGTWGGGVFLSTNNGTSWTAVNTGLTNTDVNDFAISGSNLFAGTRGGGVFLSTNNGTTWNQTSLDSGTVTALAIIDTNLFAGTLDYGVFLSTNNGISWTAVNNGLRDWGITALAIIDTNLFAGGGSYFGGVCLSTNNGSSWTVVNNGFTNADVDGFAVSGTNLFAGGNVGVFLSTNNGTSWTEVNTGFVDITVISLVVSGTYLFAGTWLEGLWRRPLSEMITSVEMLSTDLPTRFSLDQNYPNPFNPATKFGMRIASGSGGGLVTLRVYNLLGQEVATLMNEELGPGNYEVTWDASGLASGVYMYRMLAHPLSGGTAGGFTETRRLVLLK